MTKSNYEVLAAANIIDPTAPLTMEAIDKINSKLTEDDVKAMIRIAKVMGTSKTKYAPDGDGGCL